MEEKSLTCISCPIGCGLIAQIECGVAVKVTGNLCPRGSEYARMEIANPVRVLTTTVRLRGASVAVAPVKSDKPIPLDKLAECVMALGKLELVAPVKIGDVIAQDFCGCGANIVLTRSIPKASEVRRGIEESGFNDQDDPRSCESDEVLM